MAESIQSDAPGSEAVVEAVAAVRRLADSLRGILPEIRTTHELELLTDRLRMHALCISSIAGDTKDPAIDQLAALVRDLHEQHKAELCGRLVRAVANLTDKLKGTLG